MSYGLDPRKLALMALGGVLVAAPLFATHPRQQEAPDQAKSGQASSGQSPQTQNASEATATPATNSSAAGKASDQILVPAGTHLPLVLHNGITTRSAQPGEPLYLETTFPVLVDGRIVIPAGSYVQGEITEAKRPAKGKGGGEVRIRLTTLILPNGYTVRFDAVPTNADTGGSEYAGKEGQIDTDRDRGADAGTVIKTGGAGAGIGAIAGGAKGAGIGAGIGAAAGLATVMMTRGPDLELPRGSAVDIMLDRPLSLDASKINFTEPGRASSLPGPPSRPPARGPIPF
jgi:Bacterial conjugation TrbI-like protein